MKKCLVCGIKIKVWQNKNKDKRKVCSKRCWSAYWRTLNPEKNKECRKRFEEKRNRKIKEMRERQKCLICNFDRVIDECHVIPKRIGGKETMWLCPNHHRLYDRNKLLINEIEILKSYIKI